MSQDVLSQLLRRADATAEAVFDADEIALWPDGALEQMVGLGLLQETTAARSVVCDGCDEACLETVELILGDDGIPRRGYVVCGQREDVGRVEVQQGCLRRWAVDLPRLARQIARLLGSKATVEEVVERYLWWLGRPTFRASRMDVFLARGAAWDSAAQAIFSAPRLQECSRAVLLVPYGPPGEQLPGKTVLSLVRLLGVANGKLILDHEVVESEVARSVGRSAYHPAKFPTPPGTTWENVKIVIMPDMEDAQVSAGGVTEPMRPDQMGLAHARIPHKPTKLWYLLVLLAKEGCLKADSSYSSPQIPKQIERLRAKLRSLFRIEADPFKPYRRDRGYEPRFSLSFQSDPDTR